MVGNKVYRIRDKAVLFSCGYREFNGFVYPLMLKLIFNSRIPSAQPNTQQFNDYWKNIRAALKHTVFDRSIIDPTSPTGKAPMRTKKLRAKMNLSRSGSVA